LPSSSSLFPYTTLFRSSERGKKHWFPVHVPLPGFRPDLASSARGGLAGATKPRVAGSSTSAEAVGTFAVGAIFFFREAPAPGLRSEEHTSELQSQSNLV